ncbi:MAG: hypothetical protein QXU93_08065 [Thermoproteus sp.]
MEREKKFVLGNAVIHVIVGRKIVVGFWILGDKRRRYWVYESLEKVPTVFRKYVDLINHEEVSVKT